MRWGINEVFVIKYKVGLIMKFLRYWFKFWWFYDKLSLGDWRLKKVSIDCVVCVLCEKKYGD